MGGRRHGSRRARWCGARSVASRAPLRSAHRRGTRAVRIRGCCDWDAKRARRARDCGQGRFRRLERGARSGHGAAPRSMEGEAANAIGGTAVTNSKKGRDRSGSPRCEPNGLRSRALARVHAQYERRIMNNVHRAEYVECLVAELLGPEWTLPWTCGYDWAPWDLQHESGCKLEVKQSAARQPWHKGDDYTASPPRFDIGPRKQYETFEGVRKEGPVRPAHIYVFAWNGETRERRADHRDPEHWTFFVLRAERLPGEQQSIGLSRLGAMVEGVPFDQVADSVTHLMEESSTAARRCSCSTR